MRILIATTDYPDNFGKVTLMYIHTRNIYYKMCGLDVTVLNFKTKDEYEIDNIKVIGTESFKRHKNEYDILILHAANIRNHYTFLLKHGKRFKKYIFFYHGHEVLRCNKVYSKPYDYVRKSKIITLFQDMYDVLKLNLWRYYLPRVKDKSYFIFVSKWMRREFLKWTKIQPDILNDRSSITYNSIGKVFEDYYYTSENEKKYDFITIRNNLDGSKYCIDLVNRLAINNPNKKFLVVGKGRFFLNYDKASNLEWQDRTLNHMEIIKLIQSSRFALMPTRTDSQGLMMCEMAATGIPLITSNIPVCHEIFGGFENVYYIDNNDISISLEAFTVARCKCIKHKKFFRHNTVLDEVNLIERVMNYDY